MNDLMQFVKALMGRTFMIKHLVEFSLIFFGKEE